MAAPKPPAWAIRRAEELEVDRVRHDRGRVAFLACVAQAMDEARSDRQSATSTA